jgi:hypothetical protein
MLDSHQGTAVPSTIITGLCSSPEPEFLNFLMNPRIDSKEPFPPGCVAWRGTTGGPVRQPYSYSVSSPHRLLKNSSTACGENRIGKTLLQ